MVMLTGGQVSMALSSGIVLFFTLLLFLAGYTLQQRTVVALQSQILPRLPKPHAPSLPTEPANPNARLARRPGYHATPAFAIEDVAIEWERLGYVQVVRDHNELCNAVMLFAELGRERSPAARVLVFPRSWVEEDALSSGDGAPAKPDVYAETRRRLLRNAVRRHKAILRPVEDTAAGLSLTTLFSLTEFSRLVYLGGPGVLLDALSLDSLLAFAPGRAFAALADGTGMSTGVMMIEPSKKVWEELKGLREAEPEISEEQVLTTRFPVKEAMLRPLAHDTTTLFVESPALRRLEDPLAFNSTAFFEQTAYVRLSDPEFPGPEFDIPYNEMVRLRPKSAEARWAWEQVYDRFRDERVGVCRLDLEYWDRGVGVGMGSGEL